MPAHGKGLAAVEHPRPVNALIDFCGEVLDFLVGEILAASEDATQKNGGVDGRKLAFLPTSAGFHMDEVEEEAVFVVEFVGKEAQRVSDALDNLGRLSVITMVANA